MTTERDAADVRPDGAAPSTMNPDTADAKPSAPDAETPDAATVGPTDVAETAVEAPVAPSPDAAKDSEPALAFPTGFMEFTVPTPRAEPLHITAGSDGNMYFTETAGNKIGRITPEGQITEFPLPPGITGSSNPRPHDITLGPDGNVWFTELGVDRISRLTPQGTLMHTNLPATFKVPMGITTGPDGAIWFTAQLTNNIGRLGMNGELKAFPLPSMDLAPAPSMDPPVFDIVKGNDGNLWFTRPAAKTLGNITPAGVLKILPPLGIMANTPYYLTPGPNGNIWYTTTSQYMGVIYDGSVRTGRSEWSVGTTTGKLGGITRAEDGSVYFAIWSRSRIGRTVPATGTNSNHVTAEFGDGLTGATDDIAAGPGRTLWFTQRSSNKVGRVKY